MPALMHTSRRTLPFRANNYWIMLSGFFQSNFDTSYLVDNLFFRTFRLYLLQITSDSTRIHDLFVLYLSQYLFESHIFISYENFCLTFFMFHFKGKINQISFVCLFFFRLLHFLQSFIN